MNRSIIPVSALLTLGIISIANVKENDELFSNREIIGYLVVFTMISAAHDLGAPVANGFALMVLVAIALSRGETALEFINDKTQNVSNKREPSQARRRLV